MCFIHKNIGLEIYLTEVCFSHSNWIVVAIYKLRADIFLVRIKTQTDSNVIHSKIMCEFLLRSVPCFLNDSTPSSDQNWSGTGVARGNRASVDVALFYTLTGVAYTSRY